MKLPNSYYRPTNSANQNFRNQTSTLKKWLYWGLSWLFFIFNSFAFFDWHPCSITLFDRQTKPGQWVFQKYKTYTKSYVGLYPYAPRYCDYLGKGPTIEKDQRKELQALIDTLTNTPAETASYRSILSSAKEGLEFNMEYEDRYCSPLHKGIWCSSGLITCYKDGVANSLLDKLFIALFKAVKAYRTIEYYFKFKAFLIFTFTQITLTLFTGGAIFNEKDADSLINIQEGVITSFNATPASKQKFFSSKSIKLLSLIVPLGTFVVNCGLAYLKVYPLIRLYRYYFNRETHLKGYTRQYADSEIDPVSNELDYEDIEDTGIRNFENELYSSERMPDSYYRGQPSKI